MTVRPYQKKDFRYVQDICVASSKYADNDTAPNRALLCAMYCDYYLDNQADYCFVAVDDNDIPVGYVLSAVDLDDYEEKMQEEYLQLVRKLSGSDYFRFIAETKVVQRYIRQGYTAHFRVNVLEEHQRQGVGSELIGALEAKLREMFVEGFYVIVDKKNSSARAFCDKMGFEDIDYLASEVVYGKKLFSED